MNKGNNNQMSKNLNISKVTLRYYEKIGLIKPKRRANQYRIYNEQGYLDIMYISVLKYADFSLK